MILRPERRLADLIALTAEVNRVRSAHPRRIPPPEAMTGVQARARRLDGLAAAAAEITASYTLAEEPPRSDPSVRLLGGRAATLAGGDRPCVTSRPSGDPWLGIDRRFVQVVARLGLALSSEKVRFLGGLLQELGADVRQNTNAASAERNARAVARSFDELCAPGRIVVTVAAAPDLVVEARGARPVHLVDHAAALLAGGVVHGRLGLAAPAGSGWAQITHWETARKVSQPCCSVLHRILDAASARSVPGDLMDDGRKLGIPDDTLENDLPRLIGLLGPVSDRWPPQHRDARTSICGAPVAEVPDRLGFMYGVADLLALRAHCPTVA